MADDNYRYDPRGKPSYRGGYSGGFRSDSYKYPKSNRDYPPPNSHHPSSGYYQGDKPPPPYHTSGYLKHKNDMPDGYPPRISHHNSSDSYEHDYSNPAIPERTVFYVILSSECKAHTGPGLFTNNMAHKVTLKTSTPSDRIITYTAAQLKKKQADFHLWNLAGSEQSARIVNYFSPTKPGVLVDVNGKYLFAEERGVGTLFPNYAPVFQNGHLYSASICLKYYNKKTHTCSFVSVMSGFWTQKVSRWLPFTRRLLVLDEDEDLWFFVENGPNNITQLDFQMSPAEVNLLPGSIVIATDIGVTAEDIIDSFHRQPQTNIDEAVPSPAAVEDHLSPRGPAAQQKQMPHQGAYPKYIPKPASDMAAPAPASSSSSSDAPAPAPALAVVPPAQAAAPPSQPSEAHPSHLKSFLESQLECPICFEMMFPPIFQCSNGHCLCNSCHNKDTKCPICRVPFDFEKPIRALVLEKLAEAANIPYPCKFRANGCDQRMTKLELIVHEEVCAYRKLECPAMKGECKHEVVTYANVASHLEKFHGVEQYNSQPGSTEAIIEFTVSKTDKNVKKLRIIDNALVLFATTTTAAGLSVFARCLTASTSNISYVATILSPNGLTFSFGGPAIEIGSPCDEPTEGPCLTLSQPMMKHLSQTMDKPDEELPLKVYLKWTINAEAKK